ncbi:putative sodium-coupled neutral amino acid transporter 10 [Clonorchis sinensis]|uniref:Putative sodium-coupled neutral amino acid transporter 10 n=1 Tax=Clonorchis sinensis TaxID=79923 RepID=G7YGH3_CLOSI|nr:putative sodium-coupled neutral amino acid transporter 10 [Clonorchis sinensis]
MVFVIGLPKLFTDFPLSHMNWWRPAGLINCVPIFFASLFCQTQLHTVYCGSQHLSVSDMRRTVRLVMVIIAAAYSLFGFFGYMAFVNSGELPGNVFLIYPNDLRSLCVQAGFLFTVTVSIPLTLFPLRESLSSFLFHRNPSWTVDIDIGSDTPVSKNRFRLMTICVLAVCFALSLTTSKIEVIIQLTSTLAGSLVGYILPGLTATYAFTHDKSARQRRHATMVLLVGVMLLAFSLLTARYVPDSVGSLSAVPKLDAGIQPAIPAPHFKAEPDSVARAEPAAAEPPKSIDAILDKPDRLKNRDIDVILEPKAVKKDVNVNGSERKPLVIDSNLNGPARIDREPNENKLESAAKKPVQSIVRPEPEKLSDNLAMPVIHRQAVTTSVDVVKSNENDGLARVDREPNDDKPKRVTVSRPTETIEKLSMGSAKDVALSTLAEVPQVKRGDEQPLVSSLGNGADLNPPGRIETQEKQVKRSIQSEQPLVRNSTIANSVESARVEGKRNSKRTSPAPLTGTSIPSLEENAPRVRSTKVKDENMEAVQQKGPATAAPGTSTLQVLTTNMPVKNIGIQQPLGRQKISVDEKSHVPPKHPQQVAANEQGEKKPPVRLEVR